MPSPDRDCNKQGDECTYLRLALVTYDQPHCLLADSQQEIRVFIHGKDTPDSYQRHKYRLSLEEIGAQQSYALYALKSKPEPRTFDEGKIMEKGEIDTFEKRLITFLVKRKRPLLNTTQKIIVLCKWKHGFPNNWCPVDHEVYLTLTVI